MSSTELGNTVGLAISEEPYWLESIKHEGRASFNSNSQYQVWRNVKDYGAKGDGNTDDTAAINRAIASGDRCGQGCESTTISPALVYFPAGTYRVSSPLIAYYYTILIGDARKPPTLLASENFEGLAVIDADPYIPGGHGAQWYINQNNFFRSVRNFVIDLRRVHAYKSATGIHWQVSQATSLMNIRFEMSQSEGNNHQGIFMENGSGGFMGDLFFNGGKYGMWVGNQQFTVRSITVANANTAICAIWNWGWTFQDITILNCKIGFDLTTGGTTADNQSVGAEAIRDAVCLYTPTFIRVSNTNKKRLAGSIILENCTLTNVMTAVGVKEGEVLLPGPAAGTTKIKSWVQGNIYSFSSSSPIYHQGNFMPLAVPPCLLNPEGKVFSRMHPQYENYSVSQFISVKSYNAKGDGVSDDTEALQRALNEHCGRNVVYFPHGTYLVTSTLTIPANSILVGEAWSVLAGAGPAFSDPKNPYVVFRVGLKGSRGIMEISDIIFTTIGPAGGAIVLEWNIHENEDQQGTVGMWDSHIRLGGCAGTNLEADKCPKFGPATSDCMSAFLALHMTEKSSGYFEGTWCWQADHDLDLEPFSQISVYSGRGILSESKGPVWLIGTGSEHHVLYQYRLVNAKNHWMGLIQTESPYYQPKPFAPHPFTCLQELNDPVFQGHEPSSWGLSLSKSRDIIVFGAGLYSFFKHYDQSCLSSRGCQAQILDIDSESEETVQIYSLSTVGTKYMSSLNGGGVVQGKDNANGFADAVTILKK